MATRRLLVLAMAAITVTPTIGACGGSSVMVRDVLVDYSHDEFPSSMVDFFPDVVQVHPGAVVRFRQAWTGEPHSVTFGTAFNEELGVLRALLERTPRPDLTSRPELAVIDALPAMLGRGPDEFVVNQNAAQPCFLEVGLPPTAPGEACPQRRQPEFTGTYSYYSSGFIPYEGKRGNTFDLVLADDIAPGTYNYYCNLHGIGQSGAIEVVPAERAVPSRSAVTHAAYERVRSLYEVPLKSALAESRRDVLDIDGRPLRLPLAGVASEDARPWGGLSHRRHFEHRHGSANEFMPQRLHVQVGEKVTWTFVGRHTISFNVPRYLPVFEVDASGAVTLDRRIHEAVGWSGLPPRRPPGGGPVHADVGEWNGRGFRSTGLDWQTGDTFSVTFTQPATYSYACLIHPAMVGSVSVDAD